MTTAPKETGANFSKAIAALNLVADVSVNERSMIMTNRDTAIIVVTYETKVPGTIHRTVGGRATPAQWAYADKVMHLNGHAFAAATS